MGAVGLEFNALCMPLLLSTAINIVVIDIDCIMICVVHTHTHAHTHTHTHTTDDHELVDTHESYTCVTIVYIQRVVWFIGNGEGSIPSLQKPYLHTPHIH